MKSPKSTSLCLTSHSVEKVRVVMMEIKEYQIRIRFVGGPAKGCKMRRRKVDEAGEGGGLLVAAIRKPKPS